MSPITRRATRFLAGAIFAALILPTLGGAAEIDANQILDKMRRAMWPGQDMRSRFEVKVVSDLGEHAYISGSYYRRTKSEDITQQRFVIESPLELRGFEIAGETRQGVPQELHVFVPAVRRVRHLDVDMRKESFLGTDFNFEDLGFESFDRAEHTLKGEVERNGKTVYEIVSVPKDDWLYEKIVRYVDRDTYLPVETEYICWGVGRCRIRRIERVERIGSYDSPAVLTMEDVLNKQTTRLTVKSAEFDVGLEESLFLCHGKPSHDHSAR